MSFRFNQGATVGGYSGTNGSFFSAPISANFGNTTVTPTISHSNNSSLPFTHVGGSKLTHFAPQQRGSVIGGGASISHNIGNGVSIGANVHSHGANTTGAFRIGYKF